MDRKCSNVGCEYENAQNILKGARFFDPLYIHESNISPHEASYLIDFVLLLWYPEFTPQFEGRWKKELPSYLSMCKDLYSWDSLDGAEEYNKQFERRNDERNNSNHDVSQVGDGQEVQFYDWKHGPIERAW
eukprot:13509175-Ditylum_brightwellii.AAC.1